MNSAFDNGIDNIVVRAVRQRQRNVHFIVLQGGADRPIKGVCVSRRLMGNREASRGRVSARPLIYTRSSFVRQDIVGCCPASSVVFSDA